MTGTDRLQTLRQALALLRVRAVGRAGFVAQMAEAGSLEQLIQAPPSALAADWRSALQAFDWSLLDADLDWLAQPDCHVLLWGDASYPPALAELDDAPPLLFVRGSLDCLTQPQLAMVGSRNPTAVGREIAHDFAAQLARSGLVITSGLADGIDAASHQGALAGEGQTIAVFATGLDRVYPAKNRQLAHEIAAAGGALVSEQPLGTPPLRANFPRRNRIISGLSLGTLVVEAALRSGSLITARQAAEQGREVFAIPGSIHNPLARGCHRLIRQGAKLVEEANDVLEELAPLLKALLSQEMVPEKGSAAPAEGGLEGNPAHELLLACLHDAPSSIDQLVVRSGLTAEAVSSMLLVLELQGKAVSSAGGYCRAGFKRST